MVSYDAYHIIITVCNYYLVEVVFQFFSVLIFLKNDRSCTVYYGIAPAYCVVFLKCCHFHSITCMQQEIQWHGNKREV